MKEPIRVLFLCTGNCCRSQMAEGLLRQIGGKRFEALSAGSHPAGFVHPLAVQTMQTMGIDISGQESKSLEDLSDSPVDVVITLCDAVASEACPAFMRPAVAAHWPLPDPSFHAGSEEARLAFCRAVADRLAAKIKRLIALPFGELSGEELGRLLSQIGSL